MSVRQESRRDPVTGNTRSFWIVDLCVRQADRFEKRVRRVPRIQSRRGAEQLERELLSQRPTERSAGKEEEKNEEPAKASRTLAAFATDFMEKYAVANNKPSEIQTKRMILALHLIPALGDLRLDKVRGAEIEGYKSGKLKDGLAAKTVNNHLPSSSGACWAWPRSGGNWIACRW